MSDGLKKQIRREELAMAIANGVHPDEALSIIEAVLEDRYSIMPAADEPGWAIFAIQVKADGTLDRPTPDVHSVANDSVSPNICPECRGSGLVYGEGIEWPRGGCQTMEDCPTCHGLGGVKGESA